MGDQYNLAHQSDDLMLGWGARILGSSTGGLWSPMERGLHINVLELLAGAFAIKTLHIRLKMEQSHT